MEYLIVGVGVMGIQDPCGTYCPARCDTRCDVKCGTFCALNCPNYCGFVCPGQVVPMPNSVIGTE